MLMVVLNFISPFDICISMLILKYGWRYQRLKATRHNFPKQATTKPHPLLECVVWFHSLVPCLLLGTPLPPLPPLPPRDGCVFVRFVLRLFFV
jgi:hypothetical protein